MVGLIAFLTLIIVALFFTVLEAVFNVLYQAACYFERRKYWPRPIKTKGSRWYKRGKRTTTTFGVFR